jgi:dimethylargininase
MRVALTRAVSLAIAHCELTHLDRQPIDLEIARTQHRAYEAALAGAGCRVERLATGPDMPDSVFIEDMAIVFDEIAIVTRPGAESRRVETAGVAAALGRYRPLHAILAPGTMDGGDVLVAGRHVFVGRSSRTNDAAIADLHRAIAPYGYDVTPVDVHGCLHLKSAVTMAGDDRVLMNRAWVPAEPFDRFDRIDVDPSEPAAANGLLVGGRVIYASAFPRTLERLVRRGVRTVVVETSELAKAEGALTCCCLLVDEREGRANEDEECPFGAPAAGQNRNS